MNKERTRMYNGIVICNTNSSGRKEFFSDNMIKSLKLDDRLNILVQSLDRYDYSKSIKFDPDFVIQDYHQDDFCIIPDVLNIGIVENTCKDSCSDNLKFLDYAVVRTEQQRAIANDKIVALRTKKVAIIKPTLHFEAPIDYNKNVISKFIFYCTSMDNIKSALYAFFNAFGINDNVAFGIYHHDPNEVYNLVQSIKTELDMYNGADRYPEVIIFPDYHIAHQKGHCYLDLSSTHLLNEQAMIATKFGNPIVICIGNGLRQWLLKDCTYVTRADEDYLGKNISGFTVNSPALKKTLTSIFKDREGFLKKQLASSRSLSKNIFSYDSSKSLGEFICSVL